MKTLGDLTHRGKDGMVRVELDEQERDERFQTFYVLFDPRTPADSRALSRLAQLRAKVVDEVKDGLARSVWISADSSSEVSMRMHANTGVGALFEREFIEVFDEMMAKVVAKVEDVVYG